MKCFNSRKKIIYNLPKFLFYFLTLITGNYPTLKFVPNINPRSGYINPRSGWRTKTEGPYINHTFRLGTHLLFVSLTKHHSNLIYFPHRNSEMKHHSNLFIFLIETQKIKFLTTKSSAICFPCFIHN